MPNLPLLRHDLLLRHQARAWVAGASTRLPTPDDTQAILQLIGPGELRFNAVQTLDLEHGRVVQGMRFEHSNEPWMIDVTPVSIDITCGGKGPGVPETPSSAFWQAVPELMRVLLGERAPLVRRLAGVTEGMLAERSPDECTRIAGRMMQLPSLFRRNPWEWDWRQVASKDETINGRPEVVNMILMVKRISGTYGLGAAEPTLFDGIRVDLDANTNQDNMNPRFRQPDITEFFAGQEARHEEIWAAFDEMVGGGQDAH